MNMRLIRSLGVGVVLGWMSRTAPAAERDASEIIIPPPRLAPSLFEFAQVDVQLQDLNGNLLPRGELHCFNHNLGVFYPECVAKASLIDGKARVHLLRGEYTLVGTATGAIVTLRTRIDQDQTLTLRPDAGLDLRAIGPVEDGLLSAVPSALRLVLPTYFLGPARLPTRLAVTSGVRLDLTLHRRPPPRVEVADSYLLRLDSVEPNSTVRFDSRHDVLGRVVLGTRNASGTPCPSQSITVWVPPGAPTPTTIARGPDDEWRELSLYVTPGRIRFGQSAHPDGWHYTFYPTITDLSAQATCDLRIDATFRPTLRCRPAVFPRAVLLELPWEGGWGLRSAIAPPGTTCAELRFLDADGGVSQKQTLGPELACLLNPVPTPGTEYVLSLDLGFFGRSELRGRFRQAKDDLPLTRRETEHFAVLWPDSLTEGFADCAGYLEQAYGAISRALDLQVEERIKWSPLLRGAGGTGGANFTTHLNFLKDPQAFEPTCMVWKGAAAHELGHVFQGRSGGLAGFGGPSPACKEAFATVMRDIALRDMMPSDASVAQRLGHRENFSRALYRRAGFLAELKWPGDEACFGEYWRYYFILSHLTDIYGPAIHGKVARAWGNRDDTRNLQRLLTARGLRPAEVICATYSTVIGEDLGWLFRVADFDVPDGLVPPLP